MREAFPNSETSIADRIAYNIADGPEVRNPQDRATGTGLGQALDDLTRTICFESRSKAEALGAFPEKRQPVVRGE